ncbi:MAG: hypothetical protein LBJ67_02670 [Planctomycetaceae bacterium]|nr:hypothetical protein [Planctomycetaceae bacterium]
MGTAIVLAEEIAAGDERFGGKLVLGFRQRRFSYQTDTVAANRPDGNYCRFKIYNVQN